MKELYQDKKYIELLIEDFKDAIGDIDKVSVYNNDFLNEEVALLQTQLIDIKAKIKKL